MAFKRFISPMTTSGASSSPQSPIASVPAPKPQTEKKGIFSRAADFISGVQTSLENSIPGQIVGGTVGTLGGAIGGVVGGVGQTVKNVATGKPIFSGVADAATRTAADTAGFGYNVGKQGFGAGAIGGAGKVINAVATLPSFVHGAEDIKAGNTGTGAFEIGMGLLGLVGAKYSKPLPETLSDARSALSEFKPSSVKSAASSIVGDVKTAVAKKVLPERLTTQLQNKAKGDLGIAPASSDVATLFDDAEVTGLDALQKTEIANPAEVKATAKTYLDTAKANKANERNPGALGRSGTRATEALNTLETTAKEIGKKKSAIIADPAIGGAKFNGVEDILTNMRNESADVLGGTITTDAKGKLVLSDASGRVVNVGDNADKQMLLGLYKDIQEATKTEKTPSYAPKSAYSGTRSGDITVRKMDDLVDKWQSRIYERSTGTATQMNTRLEGLMRKFLGDINAAVKEQVDALHGTNEYSQLNAQYSGIAKVRTWLSKALGEDSNKAAGLMKRASSITDGGTKKMFEVIRGMTGIDLFHEAMIAKFIAEMNGETAASSLLENTFKGIPMKSHGAIIDFIKGSISFVMQKVAEKLITQEGAVNAVIDDATRAKQAVQIFTEEMTNAAQSDKTLMKTLKDSGIGIGGLVNNLTKDLFPESSGTSGTQSSDSTNGTTSRYSSPSAGLSIEDLL